MLSDETLHKLMARLVRTTTSFFGIFDRETITPHYINPAGLAMLNLTTLSEYENHYPVGFRAEPTNPAEFEAQFGPMIDTGIWQGRIECRLHTSGQRFWAWMTMEAVPMDGQVFLIVRVLDILYLQELNGQLPVAGEGDLRQLMQQRTEALLQSLTEQERLKTVLETALEQERTLSNRKTAFVTAISHEFRTPLAILHSSALLLPRLAHDTNRQQQHTQTIQQQVEYLTALLESLTAQTLHGETPPSAEGVHELARDLKNLHP